MGEATTQGDRLRNVAGAVLTGGASTRMGRDKSHLPVGGVPAATRVATCLAQLCTDVVIVGGDPPPEAPGRRVSDVDGPRCALRGVVGALEACEAERVFVVATDVPFVSPALLLALLAWPDADAVVPRSAEGLQPLVGLYRRASVLPVAQRHLGEERLALRHLLDAVETRTLAGADLERFAPAGFALRNLNTPADHANAEAALASR